MQYTALSVGLFAALATASHNPQHFHQRRQYNASVPSTTLTVFATEVYTITSCAPTVTDCPASASTVEQVITSTVKAYTTVCPVAEASSASAAILSSYSAVDSSTAKGPVSTPAGSATPGAPYPTGGAQTTPAGPVGTGYTTKGDVVYPTNSGSESVVLTYTLGSGTSTTVVTTTVKHTQTATVYATKPAESGSENGGVPTYAASSDSLTTTVTGTSTSTRYITVFPAPSASASGTQGAAGSSECVPVTVTVTQATATVTVTAPAYSTGANSGDVTAVPTAAEVYPTAAASESVNSELVPVSTATVIPVPYSTGAPYGNGTLSTKTKTKCSSVYPSGAAIPTGSYPAGAVSSSTAAGVPVPSYPAGAASSSTAAGVPVPSYPAGASSSTAAGVPSSSAPAGYPVASSTAPGTVTTQAASSSTAAGVPSSSAPAGYPAAYPTY